MWPQNIAENHAKINRIHKQSIVPSLVDVPLTVDVDRRTVPHTKPTVNASERKACTLRNTEIALIRHKG